MRIPLDAKYDAPSFIKINPSQCGEEVVIDWLMLSKCNIFISNLSVSTAVLLKNPNIEQIYIQNGFKPI